MRTGIGSINNRIGYIYFTTVSVDKTQAIISAIGGGIPQLAQIQISRFVTDLYLPETELLLSNSQSINCVRPPTLIGYLHIETVL